MPKPPKPFAAALLFALAASPVIADEVSFEDLVALLKAGVGEQVILRQVALSGTGFEIGVAEILALKEAGAPDTLIEALMPAPAEASIEEPVEPFIAENAPFRIFKEKTEDGQEVLHITNLDSYGRPIGGGAGGSEAATPNRYRSREGYVERPGADSYEDPAYGGGLENRVVVSLLPPAPPSSSEPVIVPVASEPLVSPYVYRDPYAYSYPRGILPGYGYTGCRYPCGRLHHHRTRLTPPGSYSHYVRYHDGHSRLLHAPWQQRYYGRRGVRRPVFAFPGPAEGRANLRYLRDQVRIKR